MAVVLIVLKIAIGVGFALYAIGAILMLWRWLAPNGRLDQADVVGVFSGPDKENHPRALEAVETWRRIAGDWRVVGVFCMGRASEVLRGIVADGLVRFQQCSDTVRLTGSSTNTDHNWVALKTTLARMELNPRVVAAVSSGYHRYRIERAGRRAGFVVSFQKAPSRSLFHVLLEPIAILLDLMPLRRQVYGAVKAARTKE